MKKRKDRSMIWQTIGKSVFISVILSFLTAGLFAQSLGRYYTTVNRIDLLKWEQRPNYSFDTLGLLMVDGGYFPTSNMQYGIMCLDRFEETADSSYFFKAEKQLRYFESAERAHNTFNGKGLGVVVSFDYKDLEAPWFSGLTQGYAISFVLRFYQLTKSPELLPLAEKLAYTMLQPQKKGGCLSLTREELVWIEEYPNSTMSPQVMNGFIYGLFGLMDYCDFFPSDERAGRIKQECLKSLKTILPTYDSKTWTRYGRRLVYPIREFYLRVQIFQMQQLYDRTGDPFFLRQLCIWAAFDHGQPQSDTSEAQCFNEVQFLQESRLSDSLILPLPYHDIPLSEIELSRIEKGYVAPFPWYGFTTTETVWIDKPQKLEIALDTLPEYMHILYKHSWDQELFAMQKWTAQKGVSSHDHTFHLAPGHYQFAIFYSLKQKDETLKVYKFKLSDP